ncbi:MAG: UbiH/UbiF/VisC/COQ6 family ubiquinone biosynthesis hydroxylase [Pseudomonadota bacterium]
MAHDFDLLIVGGGMVGASLACALGNSPLRVGVVESHPAQTEWPEESYDIRVSAITRATEKVFQMVGAWDGMVSRRITPYAAMQVWDATGSGSIGFDCADLGEKNLGYIIENRVILAALLERMSEFGNIELFCPTQVSALQRDETAATLTLDDGRSFTSSLIVGADGANSWVREQAGITTTGWPYEQTAVVATIKTAQHHKGVAYQRFMPEGPLAFLPMPGGLSSIVWSTTPERAAELSEMEEGQFLAQLQQAFGDKLGEMESTGPRGAFPLLLRHANRYSDERLVLVGNAAHAIHPLAGQGLNLGVSDIAALAEVLLAAYAEKQGIGELSVLRRYERWRKADNVTVMAAMDGFKRLFSNDIVALKLVRNLGLTLADNAGPAKNMMMRRALGLSGDLPRLSRGIDLGSF